MSERGEPSGFRTRLLNSSPNCSEILVNASESVVAEMSIFLSPLPLFRTDGIVNLMFTNYLTIAEILAISACCIVWGFDRTSIMTSVALSPFPVT